MTDKERIEEYEKRLDECKHGYCLNPWAVEKVTSADGYSLSRLISLDDIYNHAYVEENYHYMFDRNDVPHLVAHTSSGNANNNCSTPEEMKQNKELIDNLKDIMFFLSITTRKKSYISKYSIERNMLETMLDECAELDDFSDIKITDVLPEKKWKALKEGHSAYYSLFDKSEVFTIRDYKTKEEMYDKKEKTEQEEQKQEDINM